MDQKIIDLYDNFTHGGMNRRQDTGAARYNKAAADLAWSRTVAFFKEDLGAPPSG